MSNKTISINPSLFSIGGNKTKKNKEKKQKTSIKPLISPNILKNKLLKRIKEHKNKEHKDKEKENEKPSLFTTNSNIDLKSYNDEFNESLNYLQTLSKQRKNVKDKENYEANKVKRQQELERKTIKNHNSLNTPFVNVSLPEDLQQPLLSVNTEMLIPTYSPSFTLKPYNAKDQVPYGILKGGVKPTYRDWSKTQRNLEVTNPNSSLVIQGGINSEKTNRENRLNNLREKLKQKNFTESKDNDLMMTTNLIQKPKNEDNLTLTGLNSQVQKTSLIENKPIIVQNAENNVMPEFTKNKMIKRTIKRKYTLGKSKFKKVVSVLIKDRGTRKKVLTAQKDLKKKSINEVKTYLRDHNLIKIGSNAPNDVIRKLYESAMLAGEITNTNTEILLHNLTKDENAI
jgi:hypothetical protein